MIFRRAQQRYGRTPEPKTPFQRAGQVWDDRIGSARVQAANWRLIAFASLGLAAVLGGGLLWQSAQSRVVPYIVEVDRHGMPQAIAPAETARPTDPQIGWALARFITNVRAKSLDPVLMRRSWLEAYGFATGQATTFLHAHARSANPFADLGVRTIAVDVSSVVRASDRAFQIKWRERTYTNGIEEGSERWTAILSITERPPPDIETLRRNPFGIYVDGIDWSREYDASEAPRSRSTSPAVGLDPDPEPPAESDRP